MALFSLITQVYPSFAGEPLERTSFEELVAGLPDGGFSKRAERVKAIGATADARALELLQALSEKRVWQIKADKRVAIGVKEGSGYALTDALTGESLGVLAKKALKAVKINNRVRKAVKSALGGLKLYHPDAGVRLEAARALFKAAEPSLRPMLAEAETRETDEEVKVMIYRALAVIDLRAGDAPARLKAIETLAKVGTPDMRSLFASRAATEEDASVREALTAAADDISKRLAAWQMLGSLYQGISLGSVLLLAAVGLAITFGVMGVINMAHGEMVMLGAYATWGVQQLILAAAPELLNWSLAFALPSAFLVAALTGIVMERSVIRWLYGRPLETLLATWGLSLVLQQTVRSLLGPTNKEVVAPDFMTGAVETAAGITLTYNRMWIILFSLLVLAGLTLLLAKTPFGLQVRAVTQNRRMAGVMGIRTGRLDALTFGLGSGIAGIAGVALSQIDNVSPNLGQSYIIDSFMVVVFGGVGNLWGTLAGAMSLGILNKFLDPLVGAVLAKILVLVGLILFIRKRPKGLFALRGRAVEN